MKNRRRIRGIQFVALLFLATPWCAAAQTGSELLLILDASGSMWGRLQGESKIVAARRVLAELLDGLPDQKSVGLLAYGHRKAADCDDIELIAPILPLDRPKLEQTAEALNPKGKTPIARSVEHAVSLIRGRGQQATVVLITDGLETCGGDPCAIARAAREAGVDFRMHIIGFDVSGEDVSQLECTAQVSGGRYFNADDARELGRALESALAMPVEASPGRLSIKVIDNDALQDAVVQVSDSATGERADGGRTYTDPSTNPRVFPLPDGRYDVGVRALGMKGDVERRFQVVIEGDARVERVLDFSTGELAIRVTRNGALSDAVYRVYVTGTRELAANGRTYTADTHNPARVRITAGSYDVEVGSVEIASKPWQKLETVTIEPRGRTEIQHDFASGELSIGLVRGGTLIDGTVAVYGADGKEAARGRTYTDANSNPRSWSLQPGPYRVRVKEIRGDTREISVIVPGGGRLEQVIDLDTAPPAGE